MHIGPYRFLADGKSAYEIAVSPESYVEWETFEEQISLLREELKPSEQPSHDHDNKVVLDSLTSELI